MSLLENPLYCVCAQLSAGLTLISESPIAPAQHFLFFVICTWKWPHSITTTFSKQCAWQGTKNDNYLTSKCYSCRYQTEKNNKPPRFLNKWRWFTIDDNTDEGYVDVYVFWGEKLRGSMILALFHTLRAKIDAGMGSFSCEDDEKSFSASFRSIFISSYIGLSQK